MSVIPTHFRKGRLMIAGGLIAGSLFVAACGGGASGASAKQDSSTSSASVAPASVVIDTFAFSPKTVHVHVGDTVTWTNRDNILHTVTSGMRDYEAGNSGHVTATHKDGMFDMPLNGKSATGHYTFTKAGTFHYFCDRHPGMEADVEVS